MLALRALGVAYFLTIPTLCAPSVCVHAGYEVFPELLRSIKDQLTTQIIDRRSAVARQVCHTLGVVVAALGPRFEWMAQILVPVLFKVSACACMHSYPGWLPVCSRRLLAICLRAQVCSLIAH